MEKIRRVVITGVGAVTPIGVGAKNTWNSLVQGKSGLKWVDIAGRELAYGMIPEDFDAKKHESQLGESILYSLANAICDEALDDSKLRPTDGTYRPERFGLSVASAAGFFDLQR